MRATTRRSASGRGRHPRESCSSCSTIGACPGAHEPLARLWTTLRSSPLSRALRCSVRRLWPTRTPDGRPGRWPMRPEPGAREAARRRGAATRPARRTIRPCRTAARQPAANDATGQGRAPGRSVEHVHGLIEGLAALARDVDQLASDVTRRRTGLAAGGRQIRGLNGGHGRRADGGGEQAADRRGRRGRCHARRLRGVALALLRIRRAGRGGGDPRARARPRPHPASDREPPRAGREAPGRARMRRCRRPRSPHPAGHRGRRRRAGRPAPR